MAKVVAAFGAVLVVLAATVGGCVVLTAGALVGGAPSPSPVAAEPGAGSRAVPADWEALEAQATAARCPGLSWSVLGAIGRLESDSGRAELPGVGAGANTAGAEGPFEFEPATFAAVGIVGPGGVDPASPYDPVDAAYSAAALLCADGAASPETLAGALWDYNHSTLYVDTVVVLAQALAADPALGGVPATALAQAAAELGVPYRWGGTGAGGFDCSGLVQVVYQAAGVRLPRVAQDQFDATARLGSTDHAEPGDLVFFGTSPGAVSHVGLYIGAGEMIDAPHTGAVVREEPADWPDQVGFTRPW